MGIFPGNSPENPLEFCIDFALKPSCEIILPKMWRALHAYHDSIGHVATLTGPGPFTAVRAGTAFAQGLVHGDAHWSFFSTSFFSLIPENRRSHSILDTGGHHWIHQNGMRCDPGTESEYAISSQSCTHDHMLDWSKSLALLAAASLKEA